MAWVEKRPGGWIGRYRDENGRSRSTTCLKSKRAAMDAADKQEQAVKRGEWTDPNGGKITVGEWAVRWMATLNVAPKTRHTYDEILRCLILPRWGDVRIERITLADVKAWLATLEGNRGRPASDTRKHRAAAQLLRLLDAAVDEGRLPRNPARSRSGRADYLPRVRRAKVHRYLSADELHRLAASCGEHGPLVLLAGYTGLRWGELTALRVQDINLLTGLRPSPTSGGVGGLRSRVTPGSVLPVH